MKVLVIGQGGREHALVWKLAQSPSVEKVYCAPGNAGTAIDGENLAIGVSDFPALAAFVKKNNIDLTVPGPEVPLVEGIVDYFQKEGLRVFGPTQSAARMEGSKIFSKDMMRKANVQTADYWEFTDAAVFKEWVDERETFDLVVKADGLAAGKGVVVCSEKEELIDAVNSMLEQDIFGVAGRKIVVEEKLVGEEASILALIDGKTIIPLEASQDHKPAYDGDTGPNTGGMGAYCPTPLVTAELMDDIVNNVLVPIVHTMRKAKCPFTGVLYAGLMITAQGPKVLEFNVRLGDPETQPVLMRLKSDLGKILYAAADGKLDQIPDLEWDERPSLCVVMASDGYPATYQKGRTIRGLEEANQIPNVKVFHAGTKLADGNIVNDGGRVLGVTAMGDDISQAKLNAYAAVKKIRWEGAWCRKDISDKARGKEIPDV